MTTPSAVLTLLIADDDTQAREALACILVRKFPDAVIYTAGNGKTALGHYRKYLPDIAITDIIMPGLNGIQLAREIKAINAGAKLIALTGISDLGGCDDSAVASTVFDHIILKPVVFGELFAAIELCIAGIG